MPQGSTAGRSTSGSAGPDTKGQSKLPMLCCAIPPPSQQLSSRAQSLSMMASWMRFTYRSCVVTSAAWDKSPLRKASASS